MNIDVFRDYLQNKNFVMLITSFAFMFGILARFSDHPIVFAVIITAILLSLFFVRLFGARKSLLLIFIFYFGFFLTFIKIKNYDDLVSFTPANAVFTGRVVSIPNSADKNKIKFFMKVYKIDDKAVKGKTLVTLSLPEDIDKPLNIGDKITIEGNLRKPFSSTNPSQFDYGKYLRNYNAFTVLYSDDAQYEILKEKSSIKWELLKKLNVTRNQILSKHSRYLKSPNLEILGGIVFGEDAIAPPDNIKSSFINSGLLHILAASGMNVAFIYTFLFLILRFFKVPYKVRVLSGIFVVILYTLMTGLGPSVVRAALMLIFVLVGKLIDRDVHSVSLLSFVAVLMLMYNPADINNISFQMSFLVTLGLITTANIISQKFEKIPNWIKAPILIPIIAQIWIAPIQIFYFNTFSLYSVFANISTVSLLSVISFGGFMSSILALIQPIADFVCRFSDYIINYLLNLLVWLSNFYGNLPNCTIQTSHPEIYQMIIYYAALVSITVLLKFNKYKYSFITLICAGLILSFTNIKIQNNNLEIIAFDVQNADSFMIKTPQNKYFFIDTGKSAYKSSTTQAKIIMLKYLKDRGIKNIEGLIVTHFDNDHSGGAVDFITGTNVKTLYLNNNERTTLTSEEIFNTVDKINQNVKIVNNNEIIYQEPDLKISTYKAAISGKDASNGCSTIALLSYKNFETLFMADAGTESFNQVKKYLPQNVEILKVGHHGGPNVVDENMLEYLKPTVSMISTGVNSFGHPNKGTLDLLRKTEIYRTDLLNSIKISTNGKSFNMYTYNPHKKKYEFRLSKQTY